ncbi:putative membrane protein [Synechococcus sp. ROS8604]|nr:putative membrane protein [Synechococcus sp. ROS8604]
MPGKYCFAGLLHTEMHFLGNICITVNTLSELLAFYLLR